MSKNKDINFEFEIAYNLMVIKNILEYFVNNEVMNTEQLKLIMENSKLETYDSIIMEIKNDSNSPHK
jgi:hypothetical protein